MGSPLIEEAGAPHRAQRLLTWRVAACGCGGSERHQAQDPLLQNRIDLSGGGIGYGGQICPGARLYDGADHAHEEVRFGLGGGNKGISGMDDERHGWSLVWRWTIQNASCPFFFCSAAKVRARR